MGGIALQSPFGNEPLEEIHLADAPLDLVLTQIRYPRLSAWLNNDEYAGQFVSAMSNDYPITSQTNEVGVMITPDGVTTKQTASRLWSIMSLDERWKVNFGDSFISVHTATYTKRSEFFDRLHQALDVFFKIASPPRVDRVGVRYINRVKDRQSIEEMKSLVRSEILGTMAIDLRDEVELNQCYSETVYRLGEDVGMHVRSGILPPGAVLDPTLQAYDQPSWILDLDSYAEGHRAVDAELVTAQARNLAERNHRFFRWAVKEEFLKKFGAEL